MPIQIMLKHLSELWRRLTEVDTSIADTSEHIRVWFLSSVLLALTLTIGILLPTLYLVTQPDNTLERITVSILAAIGVFGGYLLVRRGHTRLASYLILIVATLAILGTSLWLGNATTLRTVDYSVVVILFASLFLSLRTTIAIAGFYVAAMLAMPALNPQITMETITQGPLRFVVLLTFVAVIFAHYRIRLENERQREVVESEQRYRMVSDLVLNYAFGFNVEPDGRVVNQWMTDGFERISGYTWKELEAIGTEQLYHPDDRKRRAENLRRLVQGDELDTEYRIIAKSGEMRWMHVIAYPIKDNQLGWVSRIQGVAQDVTERKKAEAQQIQVSVQQERFKLIGEFVMAISHDFRTALATIATSRYLLERQMAEDERNRVQGRLDVIQDSINHIAEQINNLEMISSLSNLKLVSYDLLKLITAIVREYSSTAQQRHQTLELESPVQFLNILADPNELKRAFGEIVRNAIYYTPAEGQIKISVQQTPELVEVQVQDNGIGIAAEHLPHIFEFFYRADAARSLNSGGIGLGLSIARLIVEAHGGQISVESVPDNGSTFTIRLLREATDRVPTGA
ncbi:MAG: ATP-binding protein [Anaerolineae bacterium]